MKVLYSTGFESGMITDLGSSSSCEISTIKRTGAYSVKINAGGYIRCSGGSFYSQTMRGWSFAISHPTGTSDVTLCKITEGGNSFEIRAYYSVDKYLVRPYINGSASSFDFDEGSSTRNFAARAIDDTPAWNSVTLIYYDNMSQKTMSLYMDGRFIAKKTVSTVYSDILEIGNSSDVLYVDDIVIFDPFAFFGNSTQRNRFYDLRVFPMSVSGDYSNQLTPGGDYPNSEAVSDNLINDTKYVYSSGSGTHSDTYYVNDVSVPVELQGDIDWIDIMALRKSPIPLAVTMQSVNRMSTSGSSAVRMYAVFGDDTYQVLSSDTTVTGTSYTLASFMFTVGTPLFLDISTLNSFRIRVSHVHSSGSTTMRTTQVVVSVVCLVENTRVYGRGSDGFDISFRVESLLNIWMMIGTNIMMNNGPINIQIQNASGFSTYLRITVMRYFTEEQEFYFVPRGSLATQSVIRLVVHETFLSVFSSDVFIHTFNLGSIVYPETLSLKARSATPMTLYDMKITELSDWREAIWIEYEQTGDAALSSVIQERPIDMYQRSDGSLSCWLFPPDVSPIQIKHTHSYDVVNSSVQAGGSDALVYSTDVYSVMDQEFASRFGFSTKILRMSTLERGAKIAAKKQLRRLLEQGYIHTVSSRANFEIEAGDTVYVSDTVSGVGPVIDKTFIAEDVSVTIDSKAMKMTVSGRGRI